MSFEGAMLVDRAAYSRARAELGASFVRLLGYLREDGVKSVSAIEAAMRAENAAAMVIPAHTLKGEARQFGALPLADLAEKIEFTARELVESRDTPEAILEDVVALRALFTQSLALLEREADPGRESAGLRDRRPVLGFGRRAMPGGGFGRA